MGLHPAAATLLEAARRAGRGGSPRIVLLLHLSGIDAPRPHHARIARAILQDTAERLEGEVLRLPNGDLALLCRTDRPEPFDDGPNALPQVMTRLFAAVVLKTTTLLTLWRLPADNAAMSEELARQPALEASFVPPGARAGRQEEADRLQDSAAERQTLTQQIAIRLEAGNISRMFSPSFQELGFSPDPALTPGGGVDRPADPYLAHHFAARLDERLLLSIYRQLQADPRAGRMGGRSGAGLPVHINLALPSVLSPSFDRVIALARERRVRLGVELAYAEAAADPAAFDTARTRLRAAGAALVLDGVSTSALRMTRPGRLGANLVKLDWTEAAKDLPPDAAARLVEAIWSIGPACIVLQRAETEAALAWGVAHGITRFQGRHVDAMLAAGRMSQCRFAASCSLRQCADRASATDAAGRAGCQNTALLATGAPQIAMHAA